MLFTYKSKLRTGEIVEGTMDGSDKFFIVRELKTRGQTPISVSVKKENSFDIMAIFNRIFSGIKLGQLVVSTNNLSGMIHAGLPLARALSVLQKQTKNENFKKILENLNLEISAGNTFSSALAKYPKVFSKLYVSMVKAGEESGNLAGALSEVGSILEKSNALTKKIKGALIYPGVIMGAMVIIGVLMFAFVVPTLSKTFKELGVELPNATKFIVFLGDFFSNYLLLSFAAIFGIAAGVYFLFKARFMAKYIDFILIKLPFIGVMVKELNTARTARTLSSLLISGVTITRAIEITQDVVQNIYYKRILEQTIVNVEKGLPFSKTFEENEKYYPVMMSEMIQVGEETGKLSDMLGQIATFYEGEIENKTKNLSTIIEPVLMILVGGGVGFFAMSMITPLYSILDKI